jgi:hypothetical protein
MKQDSSESGFDELMRLSQQFTRQDEERTAREKQRQEQGKKVQGVLQGLKDLNFSMAMEQLKQVATPEIIREVTALRNKKGTEDLRKTISNLSEGMEKRIAVISTSKPEVESLVRAMRTLNILLDLYFSLQ